MKRTLATAIAVALGAAGVAETTPASAAEPARPASLDQVRADALARLRSGDIQTVDRHGRRHWRGHRSWRHGGWRGRRHYYGRRHHHGHGAAIAAGAAGLLAGAIIADSARPRYYRGGPSKRWCANHYRSYDWGSSTYLGYDGRRHYCP